MHNTTRFCRSQCARRLLYHFKRQRQRHRTFAPHFGLERFAFDQFHDVETFAVLFTVVSDPRDIRMADLRGRARFAQEARSRPGFCATFRSITLSATTEFNTVSRAHKLSPLLRRRARPESRPRRLPLQSDRTSVVQASIDGVFRIVLVLDCRSKNRDQRDNESIYHLA